MLARRGLKRKPSKELEELRAAITLDEPVHREDRLAIRGGGAELIPRACPARVGREGLQVGEELDGHLRSAEGANDLVPRLPVRAKPEQVQRLDLDPVGVALEDPLGRTASPAFSQLALADMRQLVGEEPRAPQQMHLCQMIAPQEKARPRGDARSEPPFVPRLLALLARDLDEPIHECRLVDVDVRLDARREWKTKLVAHYPGDRVDKLGVARTLAEDERVHPALT